MVLRRICIVFFQARNRKVGDRLRVVLVLVCTSVGLALHGQSLVHQEEAYEAKLTRYAELKESNETPAFLVPSYQVTQPKMEPVQAPSWMDGDSLTGNWNGLRDHMKSRGIEPFVFYTAIASGNPRGGYKQGHMTAVDDFYIGVRLDLKPLLHWNGASLTISGINRDGRGLSNEYIHSQYNVQQTVGGQSLFFYQLAFKKYFYHDRMSFKIGRFGASDDINASPIYGLYVNNGIDGDIRNVLFDTQFSAYPFSTWAALFASQFKNGIDVKIGVYQTWKNIFKSENNGVDWTFHKGDGIIAMAQVGVTTHIHQKSSNNPDINSSPDDASATASSVNDSDGDRLVGHYWIGGSFSPWKGYTQFLSSELASNSYGIYAHADQRIWEESPGSKKNFMLWGTVGYYPQQNISIVPLQLTLGAIYQGLFPHRPDDKTVIGLIYGRFSHQYAQAQQKAGNGDPSYEAVVEAGHRFAVTKFLFFQPDLQWDIRPGGTSRWKNAIAAGAEMGATF